jgi:hypothetical protein
MGQVLRMNCAGAVQHGSDHLWRAGAAGDGSTGSRAGTKGGDSMTEILYVLLLLAAWAVVSVGGARRQRRGSRGR